jgi:hypothetical protein
MLTHSPISFEAIEPLIDENGAYLRGLETRAVVTEIQSEYSGGCGPPFRSY